MRFFIFWIACALLIVAAGSHDAAGQNFGILFPPNDSYVEGELIDVIVNAWPTENDEIQLSVNGQPPVLVRPYKKYRSCYAGIKLSYGMNTITVAGLKNGKQTHTATTRVYFRTDLLDSASVPPDGFKRYLFHTATNEKGCLDCHDFDSKNVSEQQDKSSCYTCHGKILSEYKFTHGPSAVWSCLECHDAKSKNPRFSVPSSIGPVCGHCHENEWDNKKYKHAPTAAGFCTVCHNPHASEHEYFLRLSTRYLCIACHDEIPTRPHVISAFGKGPGHPLYFKRDPYHPAKQFTCASCHSPHGENSHYFLRNYDEDKMSLKAFCMSCHKW